MIKANYKICIVCHKPLVKNSRTICFNGGFQYLNLPVEHELFWNRRRHIIKRISLRVYKNKKYFPTRSRVFYQCGCDSGCEQQPNNSDPKTLCTFGKEKWNKIEIRHRIR